MNKPVTHVLVSAEWMRACGKRHDNLMRVTLAFDGRGFGPMYHVEYEDTDGVFREWTVAGFRGIEVSCGTEIYTVPVASYLNRVDAALTAQDAAVVQTDAERKLCAMGEDMGVGPYDCSAQIMANRSDAKEERIAKIEARLERCTLARAEAMANARNNLHRAALGRDGDTWERHAAEWVKVARIWHRNVMRDLARLTIAKKEG